MRSPIDIETAADRRSGGDRPARFGVAHARRARHGVRVAMWEHDDVAGRELNRLTVAACSPSRCRA